MVVPRKRKPLFDLSANIITKPRAPPSAGDGASKSKSHKRAKGLVELKLRTTSEGVVWHSEINPTNVLPSKTRLRLKCLPQCDECGAHMTKAKLKSHGKTCRRTCHLGCKKMFVNRPAMLTHRLTCELVPEEDRQRFKKALQKAEYKKKHKTSHQSTRATRRIRDEVSIMAGGSMFDSNSIFDVATHGHGVAIRRTTIPGCDPSNKGLFTSRAFKKNELVTEYTGRIIFREAALERRKNNQASHIKGLNYYEYIDGDQSPVRGQGIAQFSNDGTTAGTNNCSWAIKYDFRIGRDRCFLRAMRPLEKNEEIFVSYGNHYWVDHTDDEGEEEKKVREKKKLEKKLAKEKERKIASKENEENGKVNGSAGKEGKSEEPPRKRGRPKGAKGLKKSHKKRLSECTNETPATGKSSKP